METKKVCSKCNEEKFLNEFHKSSRSKDGLRGVCKKCTSKKETIRKYSKVFELEIFIYIAAGYFLITMNGVRQALVASILFGCTNLIINNKWNNLNYKQINTISYHFRIISSQRFDLWELSWRCSWLFNLELLTSEDSLLLHWSSIT